MGALKKLFVAMDSDGDSTLSFDEFVKFMNDARIRTYVASLGLSIQDAEMIFQVLAHVTGTDVLPIDDFVEHCSRMKGYAMAIDLHQLTFEVKLLRRELADMGNTYGKFPSDQCPPRRGRSEKKA